MATAPNSQSPEEFMLDDLMRSGLTPTDFDIPPVPVTEFGINGYQIWYTPDYYKTRLDRPENKYIGPKGKQAPVVTLGNFKGADMTASVEGYKKAVAFHAATGIPTLVIDSCDGFGVGKVLNKVIVKNLEPLSKHLVILDGDWQTNERVGAALATYITLLDELTVDAVALDLGSDEGGRRLGFDDWMLWTYGDREEWPDEDDVLEDLDTLPKATVSPLDMNMAYATKSLSLFAESYIDNSEKGIANLLIKLVGKANIKYLTDARQWAEWTPAGWFLHPGKPLCLLDQPALHLKQKCEVLWSHINKLEKQRGEDGEVSDDVKAKIKLLKQTIAEYEKGVDRCRSATSAANILNFVATKPAVQLKWSAFDANPRLLGVHNGILDLETGALRDEKREDLVTKRCPVSYIAGAQHARWDTFITEVTSDAHGKPNAERHRILQTRLGAALWGENKLVQLEIWLGEGANGKSALSSMLSAALGPYAVTVPASTIMTMYNKRDAESSTPQLVRTIGSRLVFMAESKDTDFIDEGTIKQITGSDKYTPRGNYKDGGEYDITFTPILLTNNLPNVANGDKAFWDRVSVSDFKCRWARLGATDWESLPPADAWYISEGKRDKQFLAAMLAWLAEGAELYRRDPLSARSTEDMVRVTQYVEDSDIMRHFMEEAGYSLAEGEVTAFGDLYHDYTQWCMTQGTTPVKLKLFSSRFHTRFPQLEKKKLRINGPSMTAFVGIHKSKKF